MSDSNEIRVPDPFRPHIQITLSASTWKEAEGWRAGVSVDNPGYGEAPQWSPPFSCRDDAVAWARRTLKERLDRIEATRASLGLQRETWQPVDLSELVRQVK